MENMTYEEIERYVKVLYEETKKIDIDNLPSDQYPEIWQHLARLNDELVRYQCRLFSMQGKKREREFLNPPCKLIDRRKKDTGLYFYTLSPPPESQTIRFIEAVNRFCQLSVVKKASWVFEQRGESPDDFHGLHTHILIERAVKPSAFKKELKRVIKIPFFRKETPKSAWKKKNVENFSEIPKIQRYMKGGKNGIKNTKLKKVENDRLFRQQYKLDDLYTYTRA